MAPAPSHGSPDVAELGSVLDEELGRLPGELRTAVVMCDLEGLSRREAARRLGCPESTLSSRLTQARDRLVRRLTRRGVAPVVAGLVAAVPPSLARATCAAAVSVLTGAPPGVPAPVAQLSNEVIRTMTLARKAVAALVASFAAVLVTGAAIVAGSGPPAPTGLPAAKVADPDDPPERKPADGLRFVAFDGFDGKLGLNWQPIRHDPSHVSLKKNAGKLTITTQKGTIHGEAEKGNPNLPAKNIYLIDNPLAKDRDFVVTTCVVEFRPEANYHQAGLILYDDDDNYLKFTFEFNSPKQAGVYAVVVNEQNAQPKHTPIEIDPEATRLWLRFTRKGASYEYATSIDGERFVSHGTTEWGKDGPKKIGLIAKNGGEKEVAELDAQFEFFELKAP